MERVFATAPFTKLDSSVDLFVLVISDDWVNSRPRHRSYPSEIAELAIADVVRHHPVAREHLQYYQHLGDKCGVHLSDPVFESAWVNWTANERVRESIDASERLQAALGIRPSSTSKRPDRYKWVEIARLTLRARETGRARPGHIESLLCNVRGIADAVASTRDSEQFYLACTIEWIDTRLNKDPLTKASLRGAVQSALAHAGELPLGSPSDETSATLDLLAESFPKAFTDELPPVAVAQIVQLLTQARTRKLETQTVMRILRSHAPESGTATLISFALATALGLELTNQLVRAFNQMSPTEMDWDLLN
jgi:hypothetical protein